MIEKKYFQFRVWWAEVVAMLRREMERTAWKRIKRSLVKLRHKPPFPQERPVRSAYCLYYLLNGMADMDAYCHGLRWVQFTILELNRKSIPLDERNRIDTSYPHTMQEILTVLQEDGDRRHALSCQKDQD